MSAIVVPGNNSLRKGEQVGALVLDGKTTPHYNEEKPHVDGKTTPPTCAVPSPTPLKLGRSPQRVPNTSTASQNNTLVGKSFGDVAAAQALQLQYLFHYQQQLQLQVEQQACFLKSTPYLYSLQMPPTLMNQYASGNPLARYNMHNLARQPVDNAFARNLVPQPLSMLAQNVSNNQSIVAQNVQPVHDADCGKKPLVPDYGRVDSPIAKIVGPELRKGKWSEEEKLYTLRIMDAFREGKLPDRFGVRPPHTLRTFIAKWLHCDAMRITKKFAGADSTGKHVYRRDIEMTAEEKNKVSEEISILEKKFIKKLLAIQKSRAKRRGKGKRKRSNVSGKSTAKSAGIHGVQSMQREVPTIPNPFIQVQQQQPLLPQNMLNPSSMASSNVVKSTVKCEKVRTKKAKSRKATKVKGTPRRAESKQPQSLNNSTQTPTHHQEPLAKKPRLKDQCSKSAVKFQAESSKIKGAAGLLMHFANESPPPKS